MITVLTCAIYAALINLSYKINNMAFTVRVRVAFGLKNIKHEVSQSKKRS